MTQAELQEEVERVRGLRRARGDDVVILTHHYQRPELVALGDIRGDSYELARQAAQAKARHIVFCGVHFMAQSAAVLARDDQRVLHPNPKAGCPMADMADRGQVERALAEIALVQRGRRVLPLTYMNTLADVKAVVGEHGGAVCTSSNAQRAFAWGYAHADTLLFVPDEHLGRNTARAMGMQGAEVVLYDPHRGALGGVTEAQLAGAKLVLWAGYCHVHTWFRVQHIEAARIQWPGCKIYVHPECVSEVVQAADGAGSTGYLVAQAQQAAPGSVTIIGTEYNLVSRLQQELPDRQIVPLDRSLCPNMYRITLRHLRETLTSLSQANTVTVAEPDRQGARLALQRMLEL